MVLHLSLLICLFLRHLLIVHLQVVVTTSTSEGLKSVQAVAFAFTTPRVSSTHVIIGRAFLARLSDLK
jgi:branched-subunit amino acid transport protein